MKKLMFAVIACAMDLSLLKRTYLVKPTTGNFQPGVIYTISL